MLRRVRLAFALAVQTRSLIFGSQLAARPYLSRGALVEIHVVGWDVHETVYLACNQDRMRTCDRSRFRSLVASALSALLDPAADAAA